ncbi:MAG: hypothetical protein IPK83_13115 [Planctomycetes bacterium]|nr:hypothetical protein [Planctomycetota bacterium]
MSLGKSRRKFHPEHFSGPLILKCRRASATTSSKSMPNAMQAIPAIDDDSVSRRTHDAILFDVLMPNQLLRGMSIHIRSTKQN